MPNSERVVDPDDARRATFTISRMDRASRREHLTGLLDELRQQRKVDVDQVLMELVHFVFELDDDVRQLNDRVGRLERRG